MRACALWLLAAIVPLGCAHQDTAASAVIAGDYRLGPDDLIDVAVWKEPALSATVPVRPDGKISLPMAGDLVASGSTAAELQREVTARLRAYVTEPMVTVMVKEVRSPRFFVLGEVAHPGAFPLAGGISVVEAVSLAGGTTEFAKKGRITVLRRGAHARPTRLRVDLDDVLAGRADALALHPGDTVFVP